MKFNIAWDSLEKENRNLKILVIALLLLSISMSVAVMATSAQAPLVIERGCATKVLTPENAHATDEEMKAFAIEALRARFNSKGGNLEFLSFKQRGYRASEQDELGKQKMTQVVIVNDATVEKDGLIVDSDRLISVGEIRSTFRFPLKLKLEVTSRTESNPYGLILIEVDQLKSDLADPKARGEEEKN